MTFVKGKSGNPTGRPKVVAHVRDLARVYTEEAVGTLVSIMRDVSAAPAARVAAADKLIDRGYGKAAQPIDGDGDGGPVNFIVRRIELVAPASDDSED